MPVLYFCLTKAKVLLQPLTHTSPSPTEVCPWARGGESSGLSPAEDSGEKFTHQEAQEAPLTTAGV